MSTQNKGDELRKIIWQSEIYKGFCSEHCDCGDEYTMELIKQIRQWAASEMRGIVDSMSMWADEHDKLFRKIDDFEKGGVNEKAKP